MALVPKKRSFEYTENHLEQIEAIKAFMAKNDFTQTAMAKLSRINEGTFSSVMSGKYPTNPGKHLVKAMTAIENYEPRKRHSPDEVIETSVFKIVQTACQMARRNRNIAVGSMYVGLGKTTAAKHYANGDPNVHLIEADPAMNANTLTRQLAKSLKIIGGKTVADRYEEIIEQLHGTDSLIIVDEAETMSAKALHLIRRIRDKAGIGVVLLGTEYLTGIIAPEHGQFDQIRSRVGFWPQTIQTITYEDCEAVCRARLGDVPEDVIKRIWQYASGSMRMLDEGFINNIRTYRKDRELTPDFIDAIAEQSLTLKPLSKSA